MDNDLHDLLDGFDQEVQHLCMSVRARILEFVPDAREKVRRGYNSLAYGFDDSMNQEFASIVLHAGHVNLQLHRGTDLPDPEGLLEGTGKAMRHVKIRSVETVQSEDVRRLIESAATLARS